MLSSVRGLKFIYHAHTYTIRKEGQEKDREKHNDDDAAEAK